MKYPTVKITSLNADKGLPINDLEAFFLLCQKLIDGKVSDGKKGMILFKGEQSETRLSYKKAQGVLWALKSEYALRGCMSFGICGDCDHWNNNISGGGVQGRCKRGDKHCFQSCDQHEPQESFGFEACR